jgi:hypothetical protein
MAPKHSRRAAQANVQADLEHLAVAEVEAPIIPPVPVDNATEEPVRHRKRRRAQPDWGAIIGAAASTAAAAAVKAALQETGQPRKREEASHFTDLAEAITGKRQHNIITLVKGVKTLDEPSREHMVFYPHLWVARVENEGRHALMEWQLLMMEHLAGLSGISSIQMACQKKAFETWCVTMACILPEERTVNHWETGWFIMETIIGLLVLSSGGLSALEKFTHACKDMWSKKSLEWPDINVFKVSKNGGTGQGNPFRRNAKRQNHSKKPSGDKQPAQRQTHYGYSQGPAHTT